MMKTVASLFSFFLLSLLALPAAAVEGTAKPWQLNFQEPVTPVMHRLFDLHNGLLILITVICLFVLGLLVYICVRFNSKANPVPSKTTHNTLIEVIWTVVPIFILVGIAIPSLRLHYYMDETPKAEMTLKVVGHQWYWEYEYPDAGFGFESRMIDDKDINAEAGQVRLLSVDNAIYVPVNTVVRVQVTGADVIHAFAVPAFGVKIDAVPGRLNETWFKAEKEGRYFGQCSELCGVNHGFMPIEVHVVSKEKYAKWLDEAKKKFASDAAPQLAFNN